MIFKIERVGASPTITEMDCQRCKVFLEDYLSHGLHRELEIYKKMRKQSLSGLSHEIVNWILMIHCRVRSCDVEKAFQVAQRIARRGRKLAEYQYLLYTATFNFLKFEIPWLEQELDYMKVLLVSAGVFRGKNMGRLFSDAKDFIAYMTTSCLFCLFEIHDDHEHPKGLQTNVNSLSQTLSEKIEHKEETVSLYDRDDDYQKEILEEVDLGDLYT